MVEVISFFHQWNFYKTLVFLFCLQTQVSHQALEGQIANQKRAMDNMDEKIHELEGER